MLCSVETVIEFIVIVFKAEGVPINNQSKQGSGPCLNYGGLDKFRHIIIIPLLVLVQHLSVQCCRGLSTRPIALSMIAGSYFRHCEGV